MLLLFVVAGFCECQSNQPASTWLQEKEQDIPSRPCMLVAVVLVQRSLAHCNLVRPSTLWSSVSISASLSAAVILRSSALPVRVNIQDTFFAALLVLCPLSFFGLFRDPFSHCGNSLLLSTFHPIDPTLSSKRMNCVTE